MKINRTKRTFHMYHDPGHAWLKVSVKLLRQLGLIESITSFSYQRKGFAYLEEDVDASMFIDAIQASNICYTIKNHMTNNYSKIRNYCMFNPIFPD